MTLRLPLSLTLLWLSACAQQVIPSCPKPEVVDKSFLPAPGHFRQALYQIVQGPTWDQPFSPSPTKPTK
jgi:hypothetical protein